MTCVDLLVRQLLDAAGHEQMPARCYFRGKSEWLDSRMKKYQLRQDEREGGKGRAADA